MTKTFQQSHYNADASWWRGAVIYQIYPRSFQDGNGDGIGDLKGITNRLPYIASLGVDAIWISPFFKSPMKDFGYDISDYHAVDPLFGTLADFDALVERAHELELRVMVDLVISHTSDQHPWFQESRASRDNPKSNWYVWADARPDGTPPNNWLSIFGGPAWRWDVRREQYYLHNFLTSQPDLNFHEQEVQDALLAVARFWLNRGVDGFRLDTINFYFHDPLLRDNPSLPTEKRNSTIAPSVNPYNHQEHIYSKNQPENLLFLKRLRDLTNEYGAHACLGEVGEAQYGLELLAEYTKGKEGVHMCYAFDFLSKDRTTAHSIKNVIEKLALLAPDSWACWAHSNHDVVRHVTRWNLSTAAECAYIVLLMTLRGTVCLYQGEELGLPEAEIPFDDLKDPAGIEFWPEYKGRDGCRTPMVWDSDAPNGGFSTGKPWLPIPIEHLAYAVATQENASDSLLQFYRQAIALRHQYRVLQKGELTDIQAKDDLLHFRRQDSDCTMFCAFNLGESDVELQLPDGTWQPCDTALNRVPFESMGKTVLKPWQFLLALSV